MANFAPLLLLCVLARGFPVARAAEFNVRDFGARGDRVGPDTGAIQAAVDACAKGGGGTVLLPKGDYLSGTIRLASGVSLELAGGATLWASTNRADFAEERGSSRGRLLVADEAERITVAGKGTIDGQGTADYGDRWGAREKPAFRTGIAMFTGCRDITVRGITIRHSDSWTLHFKDCDDVTVDGVTIRNNYRRLNSDGVDPNSCRRVRITRCSIVAGDDCIVLKSTGDRPCEDVLVSDCSLESAASALKLGTESHGDFRRIRFERCAIRNTPTGLGLYLKDGATMENVVFSDIQIESSSATNRTVTPIFMDIERRHASSKIGKIRDVSFENIGIRGGAGSLIQGMPESPIENLTLRNISMHVERAMDYSRRTKPVGGNRTFRDDRDTVFARLPTYFAIAHVRGLTIDGITVDIAPDAFRDFPRSAIACRHILGGVIRGVRRTPGHEAVAPPAIDVGTCQELDIQNR